MNGVLFRAVAAVALIGGSWAAAADRTGGVFGFEAWHAEITRIGLDPDRVVYPFGLTPEMRRWAEEHVIAGQRGSSALQRLERLQEALFSDGAFDFSYDEIRTLTAEDAFRARRGNCMSFTALFVALSRGVGVPTRLMSVTRTPEVERDDRLVVINQHVVAAYRVGRSVTIFDFNQASSETVTRRLIDDVQASAMFHNNLGGGALRDGDDARAVEHLELAAVLWPEWPVGWVNLGVARSGLGEIEAAFEAYARALEVDPANSSAWNNMASLYMRLGRDAEADNARRAAARNTDNPFALVALADSAMMRGELNEASRYLRRAKWWYPKEPEVFEGMARLASREGRPGRAEKLLRKARKLRASSSGNP
jgi:Flp pilus assembly protein TadD